MNSTIILIELIKFYYYSTDKTSINIDKLKDAFYIFYKLLIDELELKENIPDFKASLQELLEVFSSFFDLNNNELLFQRLEELNQVIQTFMEHPPYIQIIRDLVFYTEIYSIFNIQINYSDLTDYFEANKKILKIYTKLAYEEYKNLNQKSTINELKNAIEEFQEMLTSSDLSTLTKLFIAMHQLDQKNEYDLDNSEEHSWEIILFSKQQNIWHVLTYYNLDYYGKQIYDNLQENPSEETTNVFLQETSSPQLYEPTNFLTLFLIYLDRFLKTTPNFPSKDSLIIKKYLLLSSDELEPVQNHFLMYHNLDSLTITKDDEKSKEDYIDMADRATAAAYHLNYKDSEIMNEPTLYAQTIINAIFIKCFLTLSGNDELKENIIRNITTPTDHPIFYKEKEYQIVTDIIDSIIFSESLEKNR